MLLELRITAPPERTDAVRALLEDCPGTAHLSVVPGASVLPPGDLLVAQVARESADGLITALRGMGIDRSGAISIESIDAAVSRRAEEAERAAPGDGSDAVVWEQVIRSVAADSTLSMSYLTFLTIATLIAAVAVINDSVILVIGAMVLGPEFTPLAGVALGLVHRRLGLARSAAGTVVLGFVVAIAVTMVAVLVARAGGWVGTDVLTSPRPGTAFITRPDRWSVVIAVLAGIAGTLSLTAAKSSALVGVFISVTTVPAAGEIAVSGALGGGAQVLSAATQLGINLLGIVLAAAATFAVQRALGSRQDVGRRVSARVKLR